jgi:ribonuclease HI
MPEPAGEGGTTRAEINSLLSAMAADQTSEEKSAEALTDISEKVDQIADRVTGKKPKEEVEEDARASAKNFVSLGDLRLLKLFHLEKQMLVVLLPLFWGRLALL